MGGLRFRGRLVPTLLAPLALAVGIAGCGGEKTVTVTVTTGPASPAGGSQAQGSPDSRDERGVIAGYVDNMSVESDSLVLTGWAGSADMSKPATIVVAQVRGKTVAEAVPAVKREDVVEALAEPGLIESGFELRLPLQSLDCDAPVAGVRVIGTVDGESSPLEYGEGMKEAVADAC